MDINFKCASCDQELSVDAAGAGTEIQCPSCGETILIPAAHVPSIASSAAAKEDRHFAVPQHAITAALIEKPLRPLDVTAKEGDKKLRIKTMRHSDCVEVGKDHFDEKVSEVLGKIGEADLVKISPITYTHLDLATRQWITDYGVIILYRG